MLLNAFSKGPFNEPEQCFPRPPVHRIVKTFDALIGGALHVFFWWIVQPDAQLGHPS